MGAGSKEFATFVMEQLAAVGDVRSERFFGGLALKSQSALFAMIMDGALYFAVDDVSRPEYQKMGSRCFSYNTRKGRVEVKRFFEVPADALEDRERLLAFAKAAIAVARRLALARKPGRSKKPGARSLDADDA